MKLLALKPLPHGIPAGDTFEANAVIGHILITAGVAREVTDAEPVQIPKPKRTYRRRDLRAED